MNIKRWVLGLGLASESEGRRPHTQHSEADLNKFAAIRAKAQRGDAQSQLDFGLCYDFGKGVAMDESEAARWFLKAAGQNHAEAQFYLGICYCHGKGVAKDEAEAVKWYRKAAEQNDAYAQYSLGVRYRNGQGVAEDYAEAYKWFLLAAAQGDRQVKGAMAKLVDRMTGAQIAEAQKRARDWQEKRNKAAAGRR